jgi:hypothetical protein
MASPATYAAPSPAPGNVLPAPWSEYLSDEGVPYYHNQVTGQTQWERPVAPVPTPIPKSPAASSIKAASPVGSIRAEGASSVLSYASHHSAASRASATHATAAAAATATAASPHTMLHSGMSMGSAGDAARVSPQQLQGKTPSPLPHGARLTTWWIDRQLD